MLAKRFGRTDHPGAPARWLSRHPSSARRGMLYSAIHQEAYVGSSHFLPALVAIVDPLAWIRVEPVVRGIVVAKFDVHPRSLRYLQRRSVGKLPVEVVARNVQNDFLSPIRIDELVLRADRSHVCVRPEPNELQILQERDVRRRAEVVAIERRNGQILYRLLSNNVCILAIFPILRNDSFLLTNL